MNADPTSRPPVWFSSRSGGSQAVRLPGRACVWRAPEVPIRRDARSGDVVLSPDQGRCQLGGIRESRASSWPK